ncbi:nuclear transport factor 2 family protein [Streptomyces sp. F63]|uniref:nuclear transport factor 2 family protein n=1 Tax=Streptomyces sp. F63 TaxID=2824887 RepID=UPI001B388531|nr:nuclear transport factor 2 family protein [Streptomyces sp. F63]MBQ0984106.1 nuclear transport factor 2 family protein [Streptomyces sp. F63]
MSTHQRFRTAAEQRDLAALEGLFTPGARLYSPVKFRPFEGRPMIMGVLGVLMRVFEDFRYVGEFTGTAERSATGEAADSAVLIFRATVDGKEIHGMDLLSFGEDGLITELTVMVRPHSAVVTLGQAVLNGLVEDGLAPAPAQG